MGETGVDFYITGVGGQGIGLLSEILLRAYDHAGRQVTGVDTHGLAQRGGVVVSHLRVGEDKFSPLIEPGQADMVIALERTEALRGTAEYLKRGGTLIYWNAVWQPLPVRMKQREEASGKMVAKAAAAKEAKVIQVYNPELPHVRMQNTALIAGALRNKALPSLESGHVKAALADLLDGRILEENLRLL